MYVDGSDTLLVVFTLMALLGMLGLRRGRSGPLDDPSKALLLFAALNLILYFILPKATEKTAFLHFRHALIGALLLPGTLSLPMGSPLGRTLVPAGFGLALAAAFIHHGHLWAFNQEAAPIHTVAAALPDKPRVLFLSFDPEGEILRSHPYLHAGALIGATRGGLSLPDFPSRFWNLPVARHEGPSTATGLEWSPGRFRPTQPPEGVEHLLIRAPDPTNLLPPLLRLGYGAVASAPPYYLFTIPQSPALSRAVEGTEDGPILRGLTEQGE